MKYSVEIENGIAKEILVFNNKEYVKTTVATDSGLSTKDMQFCEQLMKGEELPKNIIDLVYDKMDVHLPNEFFDIAESED